jgi:hypothetical protein
VNAVEQRSAALITFFCALLQADHLVRQFFLPKHGKLVHKGSCVWPVPAVTPENDHESEMLGIEILSLQQLPCHQRSL